MQPLIRSVCAALAKMATQKGRPDLAQRYVDRVEDVSSKRPSKAARA